MKPELCLVKETQSGDTFIQHAIDSDTENVSAFYKEKALHVNGGLRVELGLDIVLISVYFGLVAWQEVYLI